MFRGCVLLALILSMLLPTWAIALLETDVAVERVSSYRVQAGDQIRIVLPGEASMAEPFSVDRQGRILLPEVGPIAVAGLTQSELEQKVSAQLSRAFRHLDTLQVYVYKKQLLLSVQG